MINLTNSLEPALSKKVTHFCSKGYGYYDNKEFDLALRTFYQAWVLLPKPQTQFVEAGWVLTALCDAYFKLCRFPQALEAANSALFCPQSEKSSFVLLRKGQVLYEQGELAQARVALHKAYANGGQKLFEKEGSQYLAAINDLIN